MEKAKKILQLITLLLLMVVGVGEVYGQNTFIADIDFSNPITDGVVAGRVNSMAIGSNANNPTIISFDGRLVLGNTANTVTIPEQQRDGQIVELSFDFAFGKLVNKVVYFNLKDAYNNDIGYFSYQPYNNSLSTSLGITTSDLPANDSNTPNWSNRSVTFTITLNYYSNQITTRTSVGNTDHMVSMTNTNAFAAFIVGSSYNNSDRYSQFDNLKIKSTTNNYSYSVKATVNSAFHSIIESGSFTNGSTVYVPYHKYLLMGSELYGTPATNNQYRKAVTLNSDYGTEETVNYTLDQQNVVFFSEAEDVAGSTTQSGNNANVRCSNALGASFPNDVVAYSIPNAGAYRIWGQVWGSSGTTFQMTVDETPVWSCTTTGSITTATSEIFQVDNPSNLIIKAQGSGSRMLDCFYLQAVLAFKEAGGTYTLGETGIRPELLNATGDTAPVFSTDNGNVLSVASDGTLTLNQAGRATVTATAGGKTAKFLVTVRSATDASWTMNYDEATHMETFSVSGTGNFDTEHIEGQRISFDVGNPNEVQQVNPSGGGGLAYGLFCIDDNGNIKTTLQNGIPVSGTYFTFTPKAIGVLSVTGTPASELRLLDGEGNVLESLAGNGNNTYTFTTQLQAEQTYYVYDTNGWVTFFLESFTFDATQSTSMTINVSDLLYATVEGGMNSVGNKLDRNIPGFALTFSGADGATVYNSDRITFHQNTSGVGQMVITPRLMSEATDGDLVFTGITLNYSQIEAGKATSALVNGQTASIPEGSTSVTVNLSTAATSITVRYGSDTDDNSFVLTSMTLNYMVTGRELLDEVLDMSRTSTHLAFEKSKYYVSYGDNTKGQQAYFAVPSGQQGYSYGEGFSGTITYTSADPSIATVSSDGKVTIVNNVSSETTISAQFAGTTYFLPSAVASYTVNSSVVIDNTGTFTIEHVRRGMVVEATISSEGQSVLSFSNTIATSQTVNDADGQLISTYAFDNGGSDDEFNVVISYVSGANAYVQSARAYYLTPELKLNYTPQAIYNHHGNWTDSDLQTKFANNTGIVECFDLEGIPTFSALSLPTLWLRQLTVCSARQAT